MHITSTTALRHRNRTLTALAAGALCVIVTMAVLLTTDELRTDSSPAPRSRPPSAQRDLTAGADGAPTLLEGDPQAFDHGVAAEARALSRVQGAPSLLEGDHGLFEAAIADELVELGLDR